MPTIALPRAMRVGGGALAEAGDALFQLGLQHPVIITDRFLQNSGIVERLQKILFQKGITARVFADTVPDPTSDCIDAAVKFIEDGERDCVIGFGGGSPIDTAKAAAALAIRGGAMRDLKVPHREDRPRLPIVAIPTTAGTGSEATQFTIVTDGETNEKMLCAGLAYLPTLAIVDYELTLTMPRRLTADTGIDALTHAIEAYVSKKANPFADSMALSAMRLIWNSLRQAFHEPANKAAREGMMLGAMQAGMAFSNASVCLVHGMSRPVGAHFHVAHGLSNAMLLPAVTAWSVQGATSRYADCARMMNIADAAASDPVAADNMVEALRSLNAELKVPNPQAYGLDEHRWNDLLPLMAEQALASGSPGNNPRVPDAKQIVQIYHEIWA